MEVAVLGTGIMGAAMARNLARAGHRVRVWNRTREKAAPLAGDGAVVMDTPAGAVAGAEVVQTALFDGKTALAVMREAAPELRPGALWVQSSTAAIEDAPVLADFARENGAVYVDAPVLGTRRPAERGELVVLAAGPEQARTPLDPVFRAIGHRTLWVGTEPGRATRLKLVINNWVLLLNHGVAETISLAEALDVDPDDFLDAVSGGSLDAGYLHLKAAAIRSRDFTPSFAVDTAEKDTELILSAAREAGISLPLAAAGAERFRKAAAEGHGAEDMAASYFASFT
ncbi:NAD(P)-dependent oxidoreductase [Actinocorallia populi]|uniref:NAD(P)-dependent oxidoreductase n=1 Tax=Actinocorallia populi TaxID=2079200 RepID=UPI001E4B0142|nr:NAD(P)-dependent oxidoreductase [Actinocorallia populi]